MWHFMTFLILILSILFSGSMVHAGEKLIIGLSPFVEKPVAKAQVHALLKLLVGTVAPGESATIFNAYDLTTIGRFSVPNKKVYAHPKAKLRSNAHVVKNLLAFVEGAGTPNGDNQPSVPGAVRLPAFLTFLGQNFPSQDNTDVLLLGISPLYDDPKARPFTMAQGHIPSDSHFQFSLSQTPFGLKGAGKILQNFRIHFGLLDDQWPHNQHHAFFVKRWWVLWAQQQGGTVVSFTHDRGTLFNRLAGHAPAPRYSYELDHTHSNKLEMVKIRPPHVKHKTSLYERPVTTTRLPITVLRQAEYVEIGITWSCALCDLDLYVKPHALAQTLFYRHTETPEGTYFKDFTRAPAINGFETVALHKVDFKELLIALNFYGGEVVANVSGEMRIAIGLKTYAVPFEIKANKGNRGEGRE